MPGKKDESVKAVLQRDKLIQEKKRKEALAKQKEKDRQSKLLQDKQEKERKAKVVS